MTTTNKIVKVWQTIEMYSLNRKGCLLSKKKNQISLGTSLLLPLSQISQSLYGGMNQREFTPTTILYVYYPIPDTKFLRYYYIYLFTAVCLFALLRCSTYKTSHIRLYMYQSQIPTHQKFSDYCLGLIFIWRKLNLESNGFNIHQ